MGFFSSSKPKLKFVEPETSLEARKRIETISQISPEGIPLQQIAGFSDLENQAFALAEQFLQDDTGEITIGKAIDVATQIAEQRIDLNTTEIQGIIQEVRKSGDLALNRIGRQLQARGVASTSAGRDITGRAIGDIERSTAAALSPLLADFRRQRLGAASLLPNLVAQKAGTTVGRIGVGTAVGEAQRGLRQRILDAVFQRKGKMFEFGTTGQASIANLLLQDPIATITGGGPSGLEKISGAVSEITSIGGSVSDLLGGFGNLLSGSKQTATAGVASKRFDPGGELGI